MYPCRETFPCSPAVAAASLGSFLPDLCALSNRRRIVSQEFDSIQKHRSPSNHAPGTNRFLSARRTVLNLDLASYREIRGGKQIHAVLADVDRHTIDVQPAHVDSNGNGHPLTV